MLTNCRLYNIENNTWVRGNTRFISSVEHDIPSTHVFFYLLYKQNSVKNNKTSMRFTTNDIFTRKNIVFKYEFSQWTKTLYNTYVYIINENNYLTTYPRIRVSTKI